MISSKSLSHEEFLRKKRNKKLWRVGIFVFVILLLVGLVSYLSHRKEARVSRIELNGGILVTQNDLESKALTYLYGSYYWLFPRGNILWYPHDALKNYLQETFRRIDEIEIHRKGLQTLVIDITERKPFAIWCSGDPLVIAESGEDCYFIDQNSTIFAKAPVFSGDAYIKYYGLVASSTDGIFIGKEYMASTTEFSDVSSFILKAKELSTRPQYLVAKEAGDFSLVLSGGAEIYFDLKTPLSIVGQNLEALLRTPSLASSTGDLPVEYIDLRYGNKLFYKLKQ